MCLEGHHQHGVAGQRQGGHRRKRPQQQARGHGRTGGRCLETPVEIGGNSSGHREKRDVNQKVMYSFENIYTKISPNNGEI